VKIEALMREHGALVEEYKGGRLLIARAAAAGTQGGSADGAHGSATRYR